MLGLKHKQTISSRDLASLVMAVGLLLPGILWAAGDPNPAPLDTLHTSSGISDEVDPRYRGSEIDISRKKLPDVQATVVPKSRQPQKPPRLIHPLSGQWYFQEARVAESLDDRAAAKENLKQALAIDPENYRFQWWQATQALKTLDTPTLIAAVPQIINTLLSSPVARGHLVVPVHQGAILLVAWFWTLLVVAVYLGWWRNIAHDLGAMIFKDRSHRLHMWLPLMIPLAFVALRPGWFGFLALMSVPLLIQTRGKLRGLLATTWILATALAFPAWPALHLAPPAIDPNSEVTLLADACVQEPSGIISDRLRKKLETANNADRQARLHVALGIQEARRGRFQTSDSLFKKVLKHDPDNFAALMGLANNTYYRGRLDQALSRYQQAQTVHPQQGEAGYNMAQVYFKKLFIPEATAALEKSRQQGFYAPTHMDKRTRNQGYSPVVYPGLSNDDLLQACAFEAENYPPLMTISSWQNFLGSPPLPLFLVLIVPLFLAVALIMWWSHQQDPRECENCGLALCRDCCRVRDAAWLCPACGEMAARSRSDVVLATLMKNRSRDEGMKHSLRIVRLGRSIPGAGHLASERFVAGWLRISLAAWGCFLVSAGWIFDSGAQWKSPGMILPPEAIDPLWLPLPRDLWTGWMSLPILVGAGLLLITTIIALFDEQNLRQGMPERFSWAPTPSNDGEPKAMGIPKNNEPIPGVAVGPGLQ